MLDATGPQTTRANRGAPPVQRDGLDEWPTLALQAHERLRADGDANGALACAAGGAGAGSVPLASDIVKRACMQGRGERRDAS